MGKGKKKGGGKATSLEASLSTMSLADSRPSTSQAAEPEEEYVGLTGCGRKKKEQKAAAKPEPIEEKKEEAPPEQPEAAPQPKPEPPKETPEEENTDGLGLTGGAKKPRNRKKKPAQPAAQPAGPPVSQPAGPPFGQPAGPPVALPVTQPTLASPVGGQPFPGPPQQARLAGPPEKKEEAPPEQPEAAPQPKPEPPKETPQEENTEGLGLTGGAKKPRNRKKKPAQPAAQPAGPPVSQPAGDPVTQPTLAPPVGGQPFPGPSQQARLAGPPGPAGPGAPQSAWPAPPAASVPAWLTPGAPPGPAQKPAPSAGPVAQPSVGPSQQRQPPTQASGDKPKYQEPLPKSKQEIVCRYTIPAKILGRSVQCQNIKVTTNYLPMTIKPMKVHRYDVSFQPDKPKKMIPEVYKIIKTRLFPNELIAFDMFKNAYCLNVLKKDVIEDKREGENRKWHEVDFPDPNGRIIKFKVSFKYTGCVDFAKILRHMQTQGSSLAPPNEEIQCMDVVLRQGTLESYVKCGRNFFKRPAKPIDLSGGLEMWTGLFQSAIFTGRPFINVDVAHKGFPIQQTMLEAWKSFGLDFNRPIEQQMGRNSETFKDFVKNLRISAKLVGGASDGQTREYIVNSIKDRPTHLFFAKDDGRQLSVYDYFLNEKRYKIKFPQLPCLWVGARNKSLYYPIELCSVVYGQPLKKQLNEFQLATMVREAATPPDERKRKIEEVARSMNYSQNVFFKKFGLEISDQFLDVEAKVLAAPALSCGEAQSVYPRRGAWNATRLLKPEALVSWGFIAIELSPNGCNFDTIRTMLAQIGGSMGMDVKEPRLVKFNVPFTELRALLFKALEEEVRFLFIIVPTRGRDYYHKVKQFAECDVGILTQCIKEQTATRRMNHQTIKNILLKVNSKLMGINQCLDVRSIPRCISAGGVMIVGADVTHPSPDQQNVPSIAAVTASIDPKCFMYNIELSIQSPTEEVIMQFEDMIADHLKIFIQRNQRPPKKIYVFRDGVSEGQFATIMNRELTGLLNAYARFSKEKPEVLFLLVQKRHHTRLFGTDRNRKIVNVEPGTVVDTQIVHPKELDFYLVSHAAIKGTARPTRYHSVCNDGGIPHDEVEQLTYYLCHLYSRCMRAVSYPTPTYYAHLACLRARSLTFGTTFENSELKNKPRRLRVLDKMLRSSRMFFV